MPPAWTLVEKERQEIVALAQAVTLSDPSAYRRQLRDRDGWARMLGGIALSHARDGDLVAVAALLRMAAGLDLDGPWLQAALRYLLDQQQPDGSFGLLAPELALSEEPSCQLEVTLRLTVEVLWALAELAAARSRLRAATD